MKPDKPNQSKDAPPQVKDQHAEKLLHPPSHQTAQLSSGGDEEQRHLKSWRTIAQMNAQNNITLHATTSSVDSDHSIFMYIALYSLWNA